jgi:hypothetical protein
MEKYYRARSTHFSISKSDGPKAGRLVTETWLTLSRDEVEALLQQVSVVLDAWEQRMPVGEVARRDYRIAFHVIPESAAPDAES